MIVKGNIKQTNNMRSILLFRTGQSLSLSSPSIIQSEAIVCSNHLTHVRHIMISIHYVSIILGLETTMAEIKNGTFLFIYLYIQRCRIISCGPPFLPPQQELDITFYEQGTQTIRMADDKWVNP